MKKLLTIGLLLAATGPALAKDNPWVVSNDNVNKECAACHMAFQAPFLPARSWVAIMGDLANHFGEDASLTDPAVVKDITDYLVANAGDANGKMNGWVKRIAPDQTPLRITETRGWIGAHSEEVSQKAWKKAGTKSNCLACHQGAAKGVFEDD
jgi:nitrate/TMAO reductase-like tetraheme cytochrome c subunit